LVVQSSWEAAAERYLIHLFCPIWNNETKLVFGLGKHDDSGETRANDRSPWDVMHLGREWAANPKNKDSKDIETMNLELVQHFEKYPFLPILIYCF